MPSASKLADIIQTLYSEHHHFESLLDTLEEEAAKLAPGKIPDYQLLLDIIDYLTRYPDQYHHPREDLLFSRMLELDRKFQGKVDRLLREHETLHRYNDQLFGELTRITEGGSAARPELRGSIKRYIEHYRQHIEYESKDIFPQARGTLTDSDLKALSAKTHYLDDPLFGSRVREQYRRLERNMQARLGAVGEELVSREMSALESTIESLSGAVERLNSLCQNLPTLNCWGGRRGKRSRSEAGPSWQARLMNVSTRLVVKPMMSIGSIEAMRNLTGHLDEQRAESLPEDISVKPISTGTYEGEWVRISGQRAQRTLLYLPGGGFIMRTRVGHSAFVARICRVARARALVVHYRLAPEVPFPGGLEDCVAAFHDLLKQGCDPSNITIAGDSAGGGLVLSTLLALRDEGSPMPAGAIVLSPLADLSYSGESREFNKRRDPMLPNHRASHMHQIYMGDALPEDRYVSPVLADFEGLPPILGQVGSTEILLDDTIRAAAQAEKVGVPFYLEIWEEMPHVFPMLGILPESQVAIDRMGEFIINGTLDELPPRHGSSDPGFGRPRRRRRRGRAQ
jgi:monoterpene epsilon-lactone hydrolase